MKSIKVVSVWNVVEETGFESEPIKICNSKRLAEHYKRVLAPKYKQAFGIPLTIVEDKLYIDTKYKFEPEVFLEKWNTNRRFVEYYNEEVHAARIKDTWTDNDYHSGHDIADLMNTLNSQIFYVCDLNNQELEDFQIKLLDLLRDMYKKKHDEDSNDFNEGYLKSLDDVIKEVKEMVL